MNRIPWILTRSTNADELHKPLCKSGLNEEEVKELERILQAVMATKNNINIII